MAAINPSSNSGLMSQVWSRSLEDAVYDRMIFIPNIREFEKLNNQLTVRKMARFSTSTLAQSADGVSLTYSQTNDTAVTLTPAGVYVATNFSRNFTAQLDLSPDGPFRQNCEDALSEGMDTTALANVTSLTTNNLGAYANVVDAGTLRNAIGSLRISARSKAEPGKADLQCVFHPSQVPGLLGIPEITHAHILGVSNGPTKTGVLVEAMGLNLHLSNVVSTSGGGANNPVFLKEAFGISYNMRPTVVEQTIELQDRIIVYVNFGTNLVHDVRAANIRSTSTI